MRYGEYISQLKRAAKKRRVLALENKPTLYEGSLWIWKAFQFLLPDRPVGFGASPIPEPTILSHLTLFTQNRETLLATVQIIRGMDLCFMDYHKSKRKNQDDKDDK